MQVNKLLQGIPTTVDVKGLQLNTSLVRDPEVTPNRLIVRDWGRFKNPASVLEVRHTIKVWQQTEVQCVAAFPAAGCSTDCQTPALAYSAA